MENIAYIGIGSNLGDKIMHCNDAIKEVSKHRGNTILEVSSFCRTEPWGKEDQNWFVNSVIKIKTSLTAPQLLRFLQGVEAQLKRVREYRWSPRTIDLDILFFNDEVINRPELQIPHPLIQDRRFVLVPLNEICPQLIHPTLNESVRELLERTGDNKNVIRT